jgi:psp operon transcriptional activator
MTTATESLLGNQRISQIGEQASRAAAQAVLIIGERGTGKLIAHRLHYLSARWDQSFVTVNCATLSESLLETELSATRRALSLAPPAPGALRAGRWRHPVPRRAGHHQRPGAGKTAAGHRVRRVRAGGRRQALKVDVRLVCATNEDLPALAEKGRFRHDLLDRLAFDVITLPPLRERREDILMLAEHFAHGMTRELGYPLFAGFSRKATQLLQDYPWPGNVRELKNVVERSLYRQGNPQLPLAELVLNPLTPPGAPVPEVTPPLPRTRRPRQRRPRPRPCRWISKGRWRSTRLIYSSKRCSNPSIISAKQPNCWP